MSKVHFHAVYLPAESVIRHFHKLHIRHKGPLVTAYHVQIQAQQGVEHVVALKSIFRSFAASMDATLSDIPLRTPSTSDETPYYA